jgi:hypothetical protein
MSLTKVTFSMVQDAWINVKNFGAKGDGVTDDWAAIQAAIDTSIVAGVAAPFTGMLGNGSTIYFPTGRYRISQTITIPNGVIVKGAGRQSTLITPLPSFVGPMLTDKGHAGKIFIEDLRVDAAFPTGILDTPDANYSGVTACIQLGTNLIQHGQAKLENLSLFGGATATCLRVNSNVSTYVDIEAGSAPVTFKNDDVNSVAAIFERCFSIKAQQNDFRLGTAGQINNCEIEAPLAGCLPIYQSRGASINNLILSLSNVAPGVTTDALIEIDAAGTSPNLNGFIFLPGGAGSSLTNMIKDNRVNYPTYWGAPNNGFEVSGFALSTDRHMEILGTRRQSFRLRIINDGGTIKHRISSIRDVGIASLFAGKISGASPTLTNTPTGTDATTAFAAGGKIGSASPSLFIFNTQTQLGTGASNTMSGTTVIAVNSSGTALTVAASAAALDVDGVTRNYYALQFLNASSGAAFNLNTLSAGQLIDVIFDGYMY